MNCWIAFQKASQINLAVWRFGSSWSSAVGQTGALANEEWLFWASLSVAGSTGRLKMSSPSFASPPPPMFELMSASREKELLLVDTGRPRALSLQQTGLMGGNSDGLGFSCWNIQGVSVSGVAPVWVSPASGRIQQEAALLREPHPS